MFKLLLIAAILSLLQLENQLEYDDDFESDFLKLGDTVCFSYRFYPGDTLLYYIHSFDSIIIDNDSPLLRERFERIKIICDSVNSKGHFFLRQTLLNYLAYESIREYKNIERTTSPWINRMIGYEIDSLGKRYSYFVDDSTLAAVAPGGAFAPHLLFPLGANCKRVNESWNVESLDDLPENGIPVPIVNQASLFRANDYGDTLGRRCIKLEYIKTAQGSNWVKTNNDFILVTVIANGFGFLFLDSLERVPVHYFATLEQKLTINLPDGSIKPGLHYISTNFTLEYINDRTRRMQKSIKPKPGRK